ncbi:hypothetical protein CHS0354_007840 [Potamilus streckersoni]|uniref:Uncharacterized protein n=1 Tax=Potamilus streckersoni TaxID=2493646 RepID=A0AAE0VX00_9BIVA|nr:hypothetical protein CHS0354_007840 [Potamilus streckersoni]
MATDDEHSELETSVNVHIEHVIEPLKFTLLSENNQLLLVSDLDTKRPPSDNFQTVQFVANVSSPKQDEDTRNVGKDNSDVMNASTMARIVKKASWNKLTSLADNIQNLFSADIGVSRRQVQSDENRECIQMVFNPSAIHQLFIVFPSRILLLDIDMKLVLNSTRLDPLSSALVKPLNRVNKSVSWPLNSVIYFPANGRRLYTAFTPMDASPSE